MTDTDPAASKLDEAIGWHVRLSADYSTDADWQGFGAWLEGDSANRAAYDRVEDFELELFPEAGKSQGHSTAGDRSGSLSAFRRATSAQRAVRFRRPWIAAAGLLAASMIVALVVWPGAPAPVEYATRIGESRTVSLPDGTRLDINTHTRLVARVDRTLRRVSLLEGEAIFRVAKDTQHPFLVTSGESQLRVVGTAFDVLRSNRVTTVVLAEGTVVVTTGRDDGRHMAFTLTPGDEFVHSDATGLSTVRRVDPADAFAWQKGYLVYRNAPLAQVVSDLSRYFPVPMVLGDEAAASQRFSGVLRLDSEAAVLERISRFLPVVAQRESGGRIVLRASVARP